MSCRYTGEYQEHHVLHIPAEAADFSGKKSTAKQKGFRMVFIKQLLVDCFTRNQHQTSWMGQK